MLALGIHLPIPINPLLKIVETNARAEQMSNILHTNRKAYVHATERNATLMVYIWIIFHLKYLKKYKMEKKKKKVNEISNTTHAVVYFESFNF